MQATVARFDSRDGSGTVLLDDGTPLPFDGAALAAGGLRLLRSGQRVRIRLAVQPDADPGGETEQRRVVFVTIATLSDVQ